MREWADVPKVTAGPDIAKVAAASGAMPPHPGYPVLEQTPALICSIINVFPLPGIGTLIAGSMGGKSFVVRGLLQLILTPLLIGWVWSIASAVRIMGNANWARRQQRAGKPAVVS